MQIKSLLVIGSMAVMGLAFSSCSKDVTFDSNAAFEQQKSQYEANFIKKYGPVDPNQTWDFSTMTPISGLPSSGSSVATRAASGPITRSMLPEKLEIEKDFITWMHENMLAGNNNVKRGTPFYLVAHEKEFNIVPIFQGQASFYWQLWMHVVGDNGEQDQDIKVWEKGQELEQMKYGTTSYTACGPTDKIEYNSLSVKAPQFSFTLPKDKRMYFYLLTWGSYAKYQANPNKPAARLSSLDKQMISLNNVQKPKNVPAGKEVMIIGCEDNVKGDWDYEDLVFMMYGDEIPSPKMDEIEIRETKRYLIEDLGSTDDFDFNDIVVDVSNVHREKITLKYDENDGWVEDETKARIDIPESHHQDAIVRALGGTLNVKILIGGKEIWEKNGHYDIASMLNTGWGGTSVDYNAVYAKVTNENPNGSQPLWTWDPSDNNISVVVEYPNGGSNNNFGVQTISFQKKKGVVPVIIAVDPNIIEGWTDEREGIERSWWYE